MKTVNSIIEEVKAEVYGEDVLIVLSPGEVKSLVDDHEERIADTEAYKLENQESFKHLRKSIEAAQAVVDLLQGRYRSLTGQDWMWLR